MPKSATSKQQSALTHQEFQKGMLAKSSAMFQRSSNVVVARKLLGKIRHWHDGCGRIALDDAAWRKIDATGLSPLTTRTVFCRTQDCWDEVCEYDLVRFTLIHSDRGYRAVDVKLAGQVVEQCVSGKIVKLKDTFGFIRTTNSYSDVFFTMNQNMESLVIGNYVTFDVHTLADKRTGRNVRKQQSRPDAEPQKSKERQTDEVVMKSEEPQTVQTSQAQQDESKELSPVQEKASNLVDDSDGESTVASLTVKVDADDAPDIDARRVEIVIKLQSLLEVRKAMMQNDLSVHEVDRVTKALEAEYVGLIIGR